ncbi:hypothetical protein HYDPIDRAFT_171611 [Hydnomerulius pinastri MD-312]|uniref:Uncharacterized protein n=1 Tax=Hydnomerulius pinastri MD-312 TaxID=994086 RepID=A0A0C9W6A2_9AGAM|nr:hypothetical protein HYDPIDRAFT_171611 [Hydnomerulius pinastri MD-312]
MTLDSFPSPRRKVLASNAHSEMCLFISTKDAFPPSKDKDEHSYQRICEVANANAGLKEKLDTIKQDEVDEATLALLLEYRWKRKMNNPVKNTPPGRYHHQWARVESNLVRVMCLSPENLV